MFHDGCVGAPGILPYTCYLRVYEPIEAFGTAEQLAWRAYVRQVGGDDRAERAELAHVEQRMALARLVSPSWLPSMPREEARHAFLLHADGDTYVCPVDLHLRSWLALGEFVEDGPERLVEALLPAPTREQVRADQARWQAKQPDPTVHIQTATWRVPTVWLVAFAPEERMPTTDEAAPAEHPAVDGEPPSEPTLRYRTPMVEARRRLNRAYAALRRTLPKVPAVAKVTNLGRWLESFHPHAWVELDHGGLVPATADRPEGPDDSVMRAAEIFAELGAGDVERARELHARLEQHWRELEARQNAS